ncbi:hypothetical protein OA92_03550 [Marinomonas sp. SBI22]|jgi:ribosomal-protein-alanine N-acetyltransferase|uniref:GNAT family N-acetyltransferase n=1 Tax=unclassified Marinomonas TaxID=196814 RepID=UPI0007AF295C|nr:MULTISPECIES: GNAT family N-acetyltransferase [unclassified Marinomonas]KZM44945.1 hypothetical protein OA92_03550 [Marinomonas sp. SBI22]KZM46644.1 hypothetical protein OA91_02610 [Marinomonas sp. SBI8L]
MKSLFYTRTASTQDVLKILAFEQENKDWFLNYLPSSYLDKLDQGFIRQQIENQRDHKYYLVYSNSGVLIGRFNLYFIEEHRKVVEVVYRMDQAWIGKGIASYILKRLVAYWASSGIEEIYATTLKSNLASNKLLLKTGFKVTKRPSKPILIGDVNQETSEYVWSIEG